MTEKTAAELLEEMGTDAYKWTHQFLKAADLENAGPDFTGTVLGWFANALEAGRVAQYSHSIPHLAFLSNENAHVKGWWDEDRLFDGVLMLIVSEASEALEEWRNNHKEDERYYTVAKHRPKPIGLPEQLRGIGARLERRGSEAVVDYYELTDEESEGLVRAGFLKPEGIPSELADIIIRVFDCAVEYDIDIEEEVILKMAYNATRQHKHGGKRS